MNKPALIRLLCGLGMAAGVALSPRLWGLGPRNFPRVPVVGPTLPAAAETAATLVIVSAMLASAWRPRVRWAAAAAALLLAWTDQERWQPWAWEYFLVGVVAGGGLLPARLILGGVVAWAGFWKLGPGYRQGVAPWLGASLPEGLKWVVLAVPYFEMLTGAALLVSGRAARWVARGALLAMHGTALVLLVPRGWNSIVWPWQIASAAIGWVAVGREGEWRAALRLARARPTTAAFGTAAPGPPRASASLAPPAIGRGSSCFPVAEALAVALAVVLPALWPFGVVNAYVAWRLYTGDTTDAELQRRALNELNAPLSPAPWRVLRLLERRRHSERPKSPE